jgi:hypothetical protein
MTVTLLKNSLLRGARNDPELRGNVKLSANTPWRPMRAVELEVQLHSFLTSAVYVCGWWYSRFGRFTLGKRTPDTGWSRVWLSPRAGVNSLEKGIQFLCHPAGSVLTIPITLLRLLVNYTMLSKTPLDVVFASFALVPNVFLWTWQLFIQQL